MANNTSARNNNPAPSTDPTASEDDVFPQAPASHQLTFINSQQDNVSRLSAEAAARHRHAIFTGARPYRQRKFSIANKLLDTERRDMSNQVVQSVPGQDSGQALLELERSGDFNYDPITPSPLFRGPFGIVRLSQHERTEPICQEMDEPLFSGEDWLSGLDELTEQEPNVNDLLSSLLDVPDHIRNVDSEIWKLASFEDTPSCPLLDQISPNYFTNNAETWSILSHYRDRIGPLISPFGQGQETSWMKLVMPCAVQALGELTMGGSVTHARLALLNAVLSTSAFHLGNTRSESPSAERWTPVGDNYLQRAQHHFICCLEDAWASTTKKSKYKEILMTVLSLATAYVGGHSEMLGSANMPSR